jgi:hypothetical protein
MDPKLLKIGRGAAIGSALGQIVNTVLRGDSVREIATSAALSISVTICIILVIEQVHKRLGAKRLNPSGD